MRAAVCAAGVVVGVVVVVCVCSLSFLVNGGPFFSSFFHCQCFFIVDLFATYYGFFPWWSPPQRMVSFVVYSAARALAPDVVIVVVVRCQAVRGPHL